MLSRGFTLIELSIVLVIIGLLAGGILVGRDLIHAAELQAQIKQIQEYQLAFNTFAVKYNCTPGDCSRATDFFGTNDPAGNAVVNGDGDSFVDTSSGHSFDTDNLTIWGNSHEMSGVFQQLGAAQLTKFMPASTSTYDVGKDLPSLKLNDNASFFIGASYNFATSANGPPSNGTDPELLKYKKGTNAMWLLACNFEFMPVGRWNDGCGVFMAADLRAIDEKIDDGKALSGKFMGFGGDTFFSPIGTDCLDNFEYKLSNNTQECQSLFVIN